MSRRKWENRWIRYPKNSLVKLNAWRCRRTKHGMFWVRQKFRLRRRVASVIGGMVGVQPSALLGFE